VLASTPPADPLPPGRSAWPCDAAWGLVIALLVATLVVLSASPQRADRGFIYVDF